MAEIIPLPSAPRIYAKGKVFQQAWVEVEPEDADEAQGEATLQDDEPESWCEECWYNGPCGRKDCPVEIENKRVIKNLKRIEAEWAAKEATPLFE